MVITVRLYRQHDLDLIGLYLEHKNRFSSLIRSSLIAYVRNDDSLKITIPNNYEISSTKLDKIYRLTVSLNEEHEDIIKWLSNIKPGYRNAILKNITRNYLIEPNIYIYLRKAIPIAKQVSIEYNETDLKNIPDSEPKKKKDKIHRDKKGNNSNVTQKEKDENIEQKENNIVDSAPTDVNQSISETKVDNDFIDMFDQMMNNF